MRPSLIVILIAALAAPVRAQAPADAEAVRLYQEGVARASAKDYGDASRLFAQSYERARTLDTLFAWAQVERLGGHCPHAIELYDRFMAAHPTPAQSEAATLGRRRCEDAAGAVTSSNVAPAAPPSPRAKRSFKTATAVSLTLGGLLLAAGGAIGVLAWQQEHSAGNAHQYDAYLDHTQRARTEAAWAWVLSGAGAGSLATGLLLWRHGRSANDSPPKRVPTFAFAPAPLASGFGLRALGSF